MGIKVNTEKKRKTNIRAFALLAVLCAAVFMTSCTTFNNFKNTFINISSDDAEQTIIIGVFEPQTGRSASKGKEELKGIELANSIYNNVDGYKVVLSEVDTQSSVSATRTAVSGLIEMKPVAMIGSAGEATSLAAGEQIEAEKIPTITPSSTNPLITQGNNYYFRASLTESQMGMGMAEYACTEVDNPSIGVLSIKNDSSSAAMLEGFKARVKRLKGKKNDVISYETEISPVESEMKSALIKMRSRGVNVCFAPFGTEDMDVMFDLVEKRDLANDMVFLGTEAGAMQNS